jgi:hypothetical protein
MLCTVWLLDQHVSLTSRVAQQDVHCLARRAQGGAAAKTKRSRLRLFRKQLRTVSISLGTSLVT